MDGEIPKRRGRRKIKPAPPEPIKTTPTKKDYRFDPAGYCHEVLGVKALTPMQKHIFELLLTPPYRVLVACGHGVGKCVAQDELIPMPDGRFVPARDLVNRPFELLTLVDGVPSPVHARAEWNAIEPVYRVKTDSGKTIVRNGQHPLWRAVMAGVGGRKGFRTAEEGWRSVADLSKGDLVAVADELPCFGKHVLPDAEVKILGYMVGDGGMTGTNCAFTQQEGRQLDEFRDCCESLGCRLVYQGKYGYSVTAIDQTTREYRNHGKTSSRHVINSVRRLLAYHGLAKKHSRDKFIPSEIFRLTRRQQAMFLSRLFATDGWASVAKSKKKKAEVGFCSISRALVDGVRSMLLRFGIHSTIYRREKVNAHVVSIQGALNVLRFCDRIGIYGKEEAVRNVQERMKRSKKAHRWRQMAPAGTRWERVVSIEKLTDQPTVAIEVPVHHTYLTEFYEHNSEGAAMLLSWFFDSYEDGCALVTAPTHRDIADIIWRKVRKQRLQAGLGGMVGNVVCELRSESNPENYAKGFAVEKGESFSGRHQKSMLFVFDEATAVSSNFWETTSSMFHGKMGHHWLCFFNPLDVSSEAYKQWNRPGWHKVQMGCLDHPNVIAGLKSEPEPFPGAVSVQQVDSWVPQWCDKVGDMELEATDIQWPPEGLATDDRPSEWWRPSPRMEARALGRWPSSDMFGVWSRYAFQRCLQAVTWKPVISIMPEFGCDVAFHGDDYTVMHGRWGPESFHHERHNGWSPKQTAGRLKVLCAEAAAMANRLRPSDAPQIEPEQILVKVDADGIGINVIDNAGGFNFRPVSGSARPMRPEQYHNRRAESWYQVAQRAKDGLCSIAKLPKDVQDRLQDQLLAPRSRLHETSGLCILERKEDIKDRMGCSPDDGDAFILAHAHTGSISAMAWEIQAMQGMSVQEIERREIPSTVPAGSTHRYQDDDFYNDESPRRFWSFGQ